ncbi:hypothetical protein MKX03_024213 [Papaver bracteatum]|nr:hypothetical protein MKX03_024213 [Papaver bracteatum]
MHDISQNDARGDDVDLRTYKGKALLIVKRHELYFFWGVGFCSGLTNSYYMELSQVYDKYKNQGLAFPCNQFGGQEPGNNEQIVEFACTRFKDYALVYKFLKSSKGGFLDKSSILLARVKEVLSQPQTTTTAKVFLS